MDFRGYSLYDAGAYPDPPLSGKITWRVTNPLVGSLDELDEKEAEAQRKAKELIEQLKQRARNKRKP